MSFNEASFGAIPIKIQRSHNVSALPAAKAHEYVAVFEDALDQLAVLDNIAPDVAKHDSGKQVGLYL
jgi:hypothetical protein